MAPATQSRISFNEVSSVTRPSATSKLHFRISETIAWPALGSYSSPARDADCRWEKPQTSSFTLPLPRRTQARAPETPPIGPAGAAPTVLHGPRGLLTARSGNHWPSSAGLDTKGAPTSLGNSGCASAVTVRPIALRATGGQRASNLSTSSPFPPFSTVASGGSKLSLSAGGANRWAPKASPAMSEAAPPFSSPTTRHAASGLLGLGGDAPSQQPSSMREAVKAAAAVSPPANSPNTFKRATDHGALALLSLAAADPEVRPARSSAPAGGACSRAPVGLQQPPRAGGAPEDPSAETPPAGRTASVVRWNKLRVSAASPVDGATPLPPRADGGLGGYSSMLYVRLHQPRATAFPRIAVAFDDFSQPTSRQRRAAGYAMHDAGRLGDYRVCAHSASAMQDVDQFQRPEEPTGRLSVSGLSLASANAAAAGGGASEGEPAHGNLAMLQRVNSMSGSSRDSSRLGSPSEGGFSIGNEVVALSAADSNSLPTSPFELDEGAAASTPNANTPPAAREAITAPLDGADAPTAGAFADGAAGAGMHKAGSVVLHGVIVDDDSTADAVEAPLTGDGADHVGFDKAETVELAPPPAKRQRSSRTPCADGSSSTTFEKPVAAGDVAVYGRGARRR